MGQNQDILARLLDLPGRSNYIKLHGVEAPSFDPSPYLSQAWPSKSPQRFFVLARSKNAACFGRPKRFPPPLQLCFGDENRCPNRRARRPPRGGLPSIEVALWPSDSGHGSCGGRRVPHMASLCGPMVPCVDQVDWGPSKWKNGGCFLKEGTEPGASC